MDLPRGGRSSDRAAAARRRLELVGSELAAERDAADPDPVASDPVSDPVPSDPVPSEQAGRRGRHRADRLTRRQRVSGEVHDRLPGRVQSLTGRGLTGHHIAVVGVVLAAFACLTAWWVVSGRPSPVAPLRSAATGPPSTSVTQAAPKATQTSEAGGRDRPKTPGSTTAATASGEVVVDVSGKVRDPGIVTLPAGSRVADALDAAGGARKGAELDTVNLARVLVDGEQIVIGLPSVTGSSPTAAAGGTPGTAGPGSQVNLNTATLEQLETLPGVGPVTGQAILDWRAEHGRFSSVDELLEVDGIGDATLADLRDRVTV